jgi:cysteinyl-tRNA synthetase
MHHGFVTLNHEKMSKSLGNFFTVREIFEKLSCFSEAVLSETIRFYLLSAHYRAALDFSDSSLEIAKNVLDPFYTLFQKLAEQNLLPSADTVPEGSLCLAFSEAMDDDFNTPRAIAALQSLRSETGRLLSQGEREATRLHAAALRQLGGLLGVFRLDPALWSHAAWPKEGGAAASSLTDARIEALIAERLEARQAKEWDRADEIRRQFAAGGIVIEDRPDGTTRVKR